jgi:hypothetical protein
VTTDRVLREYAAVAFFDPADILDENDEMLPTHRLPVAVRRALEVSEVFDSNGRKIGTQRKTRLAAKFRALELLAKHLGLLDDRDPDSDDRLSIPQLRQLMEAWEARQQDRETRRLLEAQALVEESKAIDLEEFRNGRKK